jgi:hypothetical protein
LRRAPVRHRIGRPVCQPQVLLRKWRAEGQILPGHYHAHELLLLGNALLLFLNPAEIGVGKKYGDQTDQYGHA